MAAAPRTAIALFGSGCAPSHRAATSSNAASPPRLAMWKRLLADPVVLIADGSGTKQVASLQTDAAWQYVDFVAQCTVGPGAGTLTCKMVAPKDRR